MEVNYSDQSVRKDKVSIFLAGPTPRDANVQTWRTEAVKMLESMGFDGIVYVPELEHDNRTFNYENQVWWEREALYNADAIVFWVPRNMKTMPALTTNVEFGYWLAKHSGKVIYGRPDDSEKNRYLDWLYKTETGNYPKNSLYDVLKGAMKMAENAKQKDVDSYQLNLIGKFLNEYPELMTLVGDVQFTPESFGEVGDKQTYGQILFPDVKPEQLKEFDRTVLSILLFIDIKENRYDKFVQQQSGANKLSREKFDEIRQFMKTNFDTPEKERLLLYYMVINDLGKSQSVISELKARGIESVDHDLLLHYLFRFGMLPTLNTFSKEHQTNLKNVLENGINVGQYIQGECVDYSFNKVLNLSKFEKSLMMAEAMLDIAGVLGHVNNQNGSAILNQSTADNIMTAENILTTCDDATVVFDKFLASKADKMQIKNVDPELRKTITRICLMMRLWKKEDIEVVENEIINHSLEYELLINEFNQTGYNECPAILLYYSPALLSNANSFFKKGGSENSLRDTLRVCLPFLQDILKNTRENIKNEGNGVVTVMLRDAALQAAQDPTRLYEMEVNVVGDNEAVVKKA